MDRAKGQVSGARSLVRQIRLGKLQRVPLLGTSTRLTSLTGQRNSATQRVTKASTDRIVLDGAEPSRAGRHHVPAVGARVDLAEFAGGVHCPSGVVEGARTRSYETKPHRCCRSGNPWLFLRLYRFRRQPPPRPLDLALRSSPARIHHSSRPSRRNFDELIEPETSPRTAPITISEHAIGQLVKVGDVAKRTDGFLEVNLDFLKIDDTGSDDVWHTANGDQSLSLSAPRHEQVARF